MRSTRVVCIQCLRAKELDTAESDRLRCGSEIAPDRRRCRQGAQSKAEAFNREPPVVANLIHRGKELLPCDVPGTRSASIVFTRVQMLEMRRRMTHGVANRFLFDVGVKRIQQDPDRRFPDRITQLRCIGDGVEEVRFESVQRLERDFDTGGLDRRRKALPAVHGPFPLLGRAPVAGQIADRGVHRPGKNRSRRRPSQRQCTLRGACTPVDGRWHQTTPGSCRPEQW